MYSQIVNFLYTLYLIRDFVVWLSIVSGFLIVIAFFAILLTHCGYETIYRSDDNEEKEEKQKLNNFITKLIKIEIITAVISIFIFAISLFFVNSVILDPKWQIARQVAPQVDLHIEKHPNTLLDLHNLVDFTENVITSVADKIIEWVK